MAASIAPAPKRRCVLGKPSSSHLACPFIANPDLVQRMQQGTPLAAPNPASFYTPGAEGYVDYPAPPGH